MILNDENIIYNSIYNHNIQLLNPGRSHSTTTKPPFSYGFSMVCCMFTRGFCCLMTSEIGLSQMKAGRLRFRRRYSGHTHPAGGAASTWLGDRRMCYFIKGIVHLWQYIQIPNKQFNPPFMDIVTIEPYLDYPCLIFLWDLVKPFMGMFNGYEWISNGDKNEVLLSTLFVQIDLKLTHLVCITHAA